MKKIIIAEKPSVAIEYARVIGVKGGMENGYMEGDKWIVTWTVGHLVTLSYPENYRDELKQWKLETLPFIPQIFKYEVIDSVKKQFNCVKSLYNRNDIGAIYYAGDSGREGLYIQMLVRMLAGHKDGVDEKIVWIDSQTDDEIKRGILQAKDIWEYNNMSDAGYARAIADYLVGMNFSRALSILYAPMINTGTGQKRHIPISVGRVMTCVLGMIVNREHEINAFKAKNFYRINGNIGIDGGMVECAWNVCDTSRFLNSPLLYSENGFTDEKNAKELIDGMGGEIIITDVESHIENKYAPLLFNLAELQGECTRLFHMSPSECLKIAQSLYEKKLTTYPRTDARVLSTAIANEITRNVQGLANSEYNVYACEIIKSNYALGKKYVDDSRITDHYAIIPTGKSDSNLTKEERAVYDIIVRRFLAVFFPPAQIEVSKFCGMVDGELFEGQGKKLLSQGYYNVMGQPDYYQDGQSGIKDIVKGEKYQIKFEIKKGETSPPKRYTSGSMILAMENAGRLIEDDELREKIKSGGIGTSATRADIIDKLNRLNYICIDSKKQILMPTNLGEMVYGVISVTLPELLSPEVTAKWEKMLDSISSGAISRDEFHIQFCTYIRDKVEEIKQNADENRELIKKNVGRFATGYMHDEYKAFNSWNTKIKCPICGKDVETTEWGFKCIGNNGKGQGCQFTMTGDILGHRLLSNELADLLRNGRTGPFYDFVSKKNKPFAAYLVWDNKLSKITFDITDMKWEMTEMKCPKCGGDVVRQGNVYKCADYIDRDNGCNFWIGKIANKTLSEKNIKDLITEGQTEIVKGFKNLEGVKFDAYVYLDEEKRLKFRFPSSEDMKTGLTCPVCGGNIVRNSYGFKCDSSNCSFFVGKILGHTVREKELECIIKGNSTDIIRFKNSDKKEFEARLYWNGREQKVEFMFDEDIPIETKLRCPICGDSIIKTKRGFYCTKRNENANKCTFYIGSVAGILLDDNQLKKLVECGSTDLIKGFRPKTKGKKPFSAYVVWNKECKKIEFKFPTLGEDREVSEYNCPVCGERILKNEYKYYCDCGFSLSRTMASVEIPEEQIKKLMLYGRTDVIQGFFSPTRRKLFSARLACDRKEKKVCFSFLDKNNGGIQL